MYAGSLSQVFPSLHAAAVIGESAEAPREPRLERAKHNRDGEPCELFGVVYLP